MSNKQLVITPAGRRWMLDRIQTLEQNLETLKENRLPAGHKERAELGVDSDDASLDSQAQVMMIELAELKQVIETSKVVSVSPKNDAVHIGTTVRLVGVVKKRRATRQVYVGGHYDGRIPWINLPKTVNGVVGHDCIAGRHLLGKTEGDQVVIPRGDFAGTWEIDEIKTTQFFHTVPKHQAA